MKRLLPLLLVLVAGCGYFNALYNAQRDFGDAERAARSGDTLRAKSEYAEAIERAAISYRRYPEGRWADDALYLIVRAHFGRSDYAAAAVAAERLAAIAQDDDAVLGARAYRGASLVRLDSAAAALPLLDSVVIATAPERPLGSFARLWRARARFAAGDPAGAWSDLDEAQRGADAFRGEAALAAASQALIAGDSARLRAAAAVLLGHRDSGFRRDTLAALATAAAEHWDAGFGASLLDAPSDWLPAAVDSLTLARAQLAAAAGRRTEALAALAEVYTRSPGAIGARARRRAAELMLAADTVDFDGVRAVLLPAIADPAARELLRDVRVVDVLVARGQAGQLLAYFAAAEFARDGLRAESLARNLFIAYADVAPTAEWAPKALIAALALAPPEQEQSELRQRLEAYPQNVYVAAHSGGGDAESLAGAEERLARVVGALHTTAVAEAGEREAGVTRAAAAIDSIRAVAIADSMTVVCGSFVDSLAIIGIRADSARAACVRGDSARVAVVLAIDTIQLMDSLRAARVDSTRRGLERVRPIIGTDTMTLR